MKGNRVMVRDLTTGKVYGSMREASLYMPVSQNALSLAFSAQKSECCGLPVEFIENAGYGGERPVKCVETEEIFQSLTAASKAVHRRPSGISGAISKGWRCAGCHWRYV